VLANKDEKAEVGAAADWGASAAAAAIAAPVAALGEVLPA
jgi:hypothetical protein